MGKLDLSPSTCSVDQWSSSACTENEYLWVRVQCRTEWSESQMNLNSKELSFDTVKEFIGLSSFVSFFSNPSQMLDSFMSFTNSILFHPSNSPNYGRESHSKESQHASGVWHFVWKLMSNDVSNCSTSELSISIWSEISLGFYSSKNSDGIS